jgi:phage gp46-like protein
MLEFKSITPDLMTQQGDVLIFQTVDGGNMSLTDGFVDMTKNLETSIYFSLFAPVDWFLNDLVDIDEDKLISQTEQFLATHANISANYELLEQAIKNDLQWLIDNKIAASVIIDITSKAINKINIKINVNDVDLNFNEEWLNYVN